MSDALAVLLPELSRSKQRRTRLLPGGAEADCVPWAPDRSPDHLTS